MSELYDYLELAGWRRRVAQNYADVRQAPEAGRAIAWHEWRAARNDLFKYHRQSPLVPAQRAQFQSLDYFPYDPAWRFLAAVEADETGQPFHYQLGADGEFTMKRVGWAIFTAGENEGRLGLYWIEGYGGGLFVPFKDATCASESYGGGRYLYDTIKGADLGAGRDSIVLDFNYAYNPSCAYHLRWVCPLAPPENSLPFEVPAGEKRFPDIDGQSSQ